MHKLGMYLRELAKFQAGSIHAGSLAPAFEIGDKIQSRVQEAKHLFGSFHADRCRVHWQPKGGYIVLDGELLGLFAGTGVSGSALLQMAVRDGARLLNCFDGKLVEFYERHGWVEVRRENNWLSGQPDVVYMQYMQ